METALVTGIVLTIGLALAGLTILLRVFPRLDRLESQASGFATRGMVEDLPERVAARLPGALEEEIRSLGEGLREVRELVDELLRRELPVAGRVRIAEEVEPLLREAVESLDGRLREIAAARAPEGEVDLAEAIARQLRDDGFTEVRIVQAPEPDGARSRAIVQARRDGMTYKGPVWLSGTRVKEHRLSSASPMFP